MNRPFIDAETKVIMNGVSFLPPLEQLEAEKYAKDRIQQFRAGYEQVRPDIQATLRRLTGDDRLGIAWDFEQNTYVLYRWQDEQYWLPLITLLNKKLQVPHLNESYLNNLVGMLRQCDLQREGDPQAYLRRKRERADKVKAANRTKGDQMLMAAIDAMSSKQIKNFIDVHRAIHTGEKIVAHAGDEKSLERMAKVSEVSPMLPSGSAFNEGMHPLLYNRDPR